MASARYLRSSISLISQCRGAFSPSFNLIALDTPYTRTRGISDVDGETARPMVSRNIRYAIRPNLVGPVSSPIKTLSMEMNYG